MILQKPEEIKLNSNGRKKKFQQYLPLEEKPGEAPCSRGGDIPLVGDGHGSYCSYSVHCNVTLSVLITMVTGVLAGVRHLLVSHISISSFLHRGQDTGHCLI